MDIALKILEHAADLPPVEALQRLVWPGDETEIVPLHMLLAAVHNGGLLIDAFAEEQLVGFVFGFPGFYDTPDGPRLKHCSHMLGIHPALRDQGLGFRLKRAQWQMVRRQGIDRITWTYDPLQSRNAYLNIARLGAVCSTYLQNFYSEMRDGLNVGLPSDRFEVDWWLNTPRVNRRLSKRPRRPLVLHDFAQAGATILTPIISPLSPRPDQQKIEKDNLLLLEIPPDFQALKAADPSLALEWRLQTRALFEDLFAKGYLVTDFLHEPGDPPRSFYVLSYSEATL
jgi:predicted GNAT superfamily acetyltransferase